MRTRFLIYGVLGLILLLGCSKTDQIGGQIDQSQDAVIAQAYKNTISGITVEARGVVDEILDDDLSGNRHQKFIVRLANGQTLLISYNIDIAPRLEGLRVGDQVSFHGEYEWNDQGGIIHWTHHDPLGRHPGGWIKYKNKVYR